MERRPTPRSTDPSQVNSTSIDSDFNRSLHGSVWCYPRSTGWTFFSNYARVLTCIAQEPEIRLRDLAERIGITRRAVLRIIDDLEEAGYLSRIREGRRNRYEIHTEVPLRHPIYADCSIGGILDLFLGPKHSMC
jgi:DNA-binding transcriptional ArsR family regulator